MNDPQAIGQAIAHLPDAPTELITAPDGTRAAIQWEGTPVTGEWVTDYVHSLIAARLVDPWQTGGSEAQTAAARTANRDRLTAWHKALAGLPREGLEAARDHFIRYGTPEDSRGQRRWYLNQADISRWVRSRAQRKIPPGHECPDHEGQRAATCRPCADRRRESVNPAFIAELRERMAKIKEGTK